MNPALVVKLRPTGPWRVGPDSGVRNRVDAVYHSDSLYGAVTAAMARLGRLKDWLAATAARPDGPAVSFSSCFPFLDDISFVMPPRTLWPPPTGAQATRVRWKGARFVPLSVLPALLSGHPLDEEMWTVDGTTECLLPVGNQGPFRVGTRSNAAVDRLTGASDRHSTACLEFRPGAGLWTVVSFAGTEAFSTWSAEIRAAFRLLADSGFGGERSRGWGRSESPEFTEGTLPELILPAQQQAPDSGSSEQDTATTPDEESPSPVPSPLSPDYWLLSLFNPSPSDAIDWARGNYEVIPRAGRIESPVRSGELKKELNMVVEGSVLVAGQPPRGAAPDVAPDGFPHPVYRAGFAVSIPIPRQVPS